MERITNRAKLVDLINRGVETYSGDIKKDLKTLYTVVFNKKNREYYRIEWGEVKDPAGVFHLWFKPEMVCVKFDNRTARWLTASERKEERKKRADKDGIVKMENGLLFINGETRNINESSFNEVEVVGGSVGSGKSNYVYKQAAKELKKGNRVLIFALEDGISEVQRRIVRALEFEIYEKIEKGLNLTEAELFQFQKSKKLLSNITIDCSDVIETNYILSKIEKEHNKEELSLVVVDSLHLVEDSTESISSIESLHSYMDKFRQELGIKVILTFQTHNKM